MKNNLDHLRILLTLVLLIFVNNAVDSYSALKITHPLPSDTLIMGQSVRIEWTGSNGNAVNLEYSSDSGSSWNNIASGLISSSYNWQVPEIESNKLNFRVQLGSLLKPYILWDIESAHSKEVRYTEISRDGRYIISAGGDNFVKLWNIAGRKVEDSVNTSLFGCKDTYSAIFTSSDDSILVAADNRIWLWDRIQKSFSDLTGSAYIGIVRAISYSPAMNIFAGCSFDSTVKIYSLVSHTILYDSGNLGLGELYSIGFSSDGRRFAVGGTNGKVLVKEWSNVDPPVVVGDHGTVFGEHTVWSVKLTPDGKSAVSCGVDLTVRTWDLENQAQKYIFQGHTSHVRSVSISEAGNLVLSGSLDSTLRQYDILSGRELDVAVNHQGKVLSANYSVTADSMVSCGRDNSVKLWKNFQADYQFDTVTVLSRMKIAVKIPHLYSYPGRKIFVPVIFENRPSLAIVLNKIMSATVKIEIPNHLLKTIDFNPISISSNRKDTLLIGLDGFKLTSDTIGGFYANVLLGDRNREEIRILDFQITGDSLLSIDKIDGSITILSACEGENPRLLAFSDPGIPLRVMPNVTESEFEVLMNMVEDGKYELFVTDISGNIVSEIFTGICTHGLYSEKFSSYGLSSGAYFIVMLSPSTIYTSRVIIKH